MDQGLKRAEEAKAGAEKERLIVDQPMFLVQLGEASLLANQTAKALQCGNEALDIALAHAAGKMPALLIVDHRLGTDESGIEVAQRIRRELDPEIPGILVTGSITPDLDKVARAANLEFLLKPVMAEKLRALITSMLGYTPRCDTPVTEPENAMIAG